MGKRKRERQPGGRSVYCGGTRNNDDDSWAFGRILRWDAAALHAALNTKRQAAGMTWQDVANEIGGVSSGMLTHLAKGGRVGFPGVMRMTAWVGQPAAAFTRLVPRWPLKSR